MPSSRWDIPAYEVRQVFFEFFIEVDSANETCWQDGSLFHLTGYFFKIS